ncbi:MAG: hypothetical protein FJ395_03645 [Verrucomicrobia bacterium]|nr:hypothetical protein [Verrucomicrobiota bacterium]
MPESRLYPADYLIILAFFAALPVVGAYFVRRMTNIKDFFSGGASLPWWLSGISFYMASFSTWAFVAYSDMAYFNGLSAYYYYWCGVVGAFASAAFFAARWRRASTTSPLEYIRERYGNGVRQSLAWIGLPLRIFDNAMRLFAIAVLVTVTMGLRFREGWILFTPGTEMYWMVVIAGVIILAYTFMGGLWAIVVTDFVQFLVILSAVIVLLILSVMALEPHGGLAGFVGAAQARDPNFFKFFNETKYMRLDGRFLIAWLAIITMSLSSGWVLVQRYYSVKTDREARKVGYLAMTLLILTPFLLWMPALLARVYLPELDPMTHKNKVYGIITLTLLPAGMMGMLIAAMFSATMSTLGGDFNAMGSVMTTDIYKLLRPQSTPRKDLIAGRLLTILAGGLTICITLYIVHLFRSGAQLTLFEMMTKLFSIFLPPMAIPMLVGLWSRKLNSASGLFGLLFGIIAGLVAFFINFNAAWFGVDTREIGRWLLANPWQTLDLNWKDFVIYNLGQTWLITSLTALATIVGMALGNRLVADNEARRQQIAELFHRLERPEEAVIAERAQKLKEVTFTPFPIIAYVFGGFAFVFLLLQWTATAGATGRDRTIGTITGVCMLLVAVGIYLLQFLVVRPRREPPASQ